MSDTLQTTISQLMHAVDEHAGIITHVSTYAPYPGEPDFCFYSATLADLRRTTAVPLFYAYSAGASIYANEAKVRALGEALERYAAFQRYPSDFVVGSYSELMERSELDLPVLDPLELPQCSEREYRNVQDYLRPPRRDIRTSWRVGANVATREQLLVPANIADMHPWFQAIDEVWALPISTGLALGATFEEATLRGAFEVIERDAFTVAWYHQLTCPRIDADSYVDAANQDRLSRLFAAGLRASIHLLPNEFRLPVIMVFLISTHRMRPVVTVACGAGATVIDATAKALDESVATRRYCVTALRSGRRTLDAVTRPEHVKTLEDHLFAYVEPNAAVHLDSFINGPATISCDKATSSCVTPQSLDDLASAAAQLGHDFYVVDLTTDDLVDIGFRTVRVLAPSLEPLSQDHNVRYLGRSRLYEVPAKLGYPEAQRTEDEITSLPHPFA